MISGHSDIRSLSHFNAARFFYLTIVSVVLLACATAAAGADVKNPATRDLSALFSTLSKTDTITEGSTSPKRTLYVFFDANCWYCHLTWKALQPYEKAGLQVRWVPVAYQKNSSTTKAAAIMQAPDRVAALRENETGYNASTYDGAIAPADFVSATLAAQFKKNTNSARRARRSWCGRTRREGSRQKSACRASRSCRRSRISPRRRSTIPSSQSSAER
jgi:thiol:disulfide interchange protein DsbG